MSFTNWGRDQKRHIVDWWEVSGRLARHALLGQGLSNLQLICFFSKQLDDIEEMSHLIEVDYSTNLPIQFCNVYLAICSNQSVSICFCLIALAINWIGIV